jgi:hypothetical protein
MAAIRSATAAMKAETLANIDALDQAATPAWGDTSIIRVLRVPQTTPAKTTNVTATAKPAMKVDVVRISALGGSERYTKAA